MALVHLHHGQEWDRGCPPPNPSLDHQESSVSHSLTDGGWSFWSVGAAYLHSSQAVRVAPELQEWKTGRKEGEAASDSTVTSECLIQVLLAKDDIQVVHSTSVELHTEDHITGRAAELLVVALELWGQQGLNEPPGCQHALRAQGPLIHSSPCGMR